MKNLPEPGLELYDNQFLVDLIKRAKLVLASRSVDEEGYITFTSEGREME